MGYKAAAKRMPPAWLQREHPEPQPRQNSAEVTMGRNSDCTFMQLKSTLLVPNFFLHNIREMLEKLKVGEEGAALSEMAELGLLSQSKTGCRIILTRNGC